MNLLAWPCRRWQREWERKRVNGGGIPVDICHGLISKRTRSRVTRSKNKVFASLAALRLAGLARLHPVVVFQTLPFLDRAILGFHESVCPNLLGGICSKYRDEQTRGKGGGQRVRQVAIVWRSESPRLGRAEQEKRGGQGGEGEGGGGQ